MPATRCGLRARIGMPIIYVRTNNEEETMAWTTPILTEICIGLEINGYLPAEF